MSREGILVGSGDVDHENASLLGNKKHKYSTEALYRNFYLMSFCFALNHGCAVSCLAYASTELGNEMGSIGSGILFICYAVTAFLLSKSVVSMVGAKLGLVIGTMGYFVYICGFCVAALSKSFVVDFAWVFSCGSAAIGGFAGGLLWTAQGRYFSRSCKLYSEVTGIPIVRANTTFAGIFATMFLGLEMITKLWGTVVFLISPAWASLVVFLSYTIASLVACLMISGLDDLQDSGNWDYSYKTVSTNAGAAARLVWTDTRMGLIAPFQIAFGFTSSFVPYYIFGTVISDSSSLGSGYVGVLSAVIVLTGAAVAIPCAWVANSYGKPVVVVVGGVCLALTGLSLFMFSNETLGTWSFIVPLLMIYGVGRGTWENTNKAVIADFWGGGTTDEDSTSAFAASTFFAAYASAMGYFTFPSASRLGMASAVLATSVLGVVTYLFAFRANDAQALVIPEEDKKAALKRQYWDYRGKRLPGQNDGGKAKAHL